MNNVKSFNLMRVASAVAGVLALSVTAATYAATTPATFKVEANVAKACSVTAGNIDFGTIDPMAAAPSTQSSVIAVKCTKNSGYSIGLSGGTVTNSVISNRLLGNGPTDVMQYNLYTDGTYGQVWGDTGTGLVAGNGQGMGTAVSHTVFGRVPAGQTNLAVGAYIEPTITVTVTY